MSGAARTWLTVVALALAVLATYTPSSVLRGDPSLLGIDFELLHRQRIGYARDALTAPTPQLPAWSSRELLGAPFWSNLQSFPWVPTRLVLLLIPAGTGHLVAVYLAALGAALATFGFARRLGQGRLAAAVSGWTFAAAGYFASRVFAGHLPLIEAYPALPTLLWLADRALDATRRPRDLIALGMTTTAVVLCGHPQLPAYAVASCLLFVCANAGGARRRQALGAIIAGAGCALFSWWPMLLLIRRSTRLLPLDAPTNDVVLPWSRLPSLLAPWRDGWPELLSRTAPSPLRIDLAVFWDTVIYVGVLPLLAIVVLLVVAARGARRPTRKQWFLIVLAVVGLALALPTLSTLPTLVPGTVFRSPARAMYLTTWVVALACGTAIDAMIRRRWTVLVGLAILGHVVDLGSHARAFLHPVPTGLRASAALDRLVAPLLGTVVANGQRVAVDFDAPTRVRRQLDDVGVFDSLILARPYRAVLALDGAPSGFNTQMISGPTLGASVLSRLAVALVVTRRLRADLVDHGEVDGFHVYAVPGALPRVVARPLDGVEVSTATVERLSYRRPSSDEIVVDVDLDQAAEIIVLETYDEGWKATIDGRPGDVEIAEEFLIAVRVPGGTHTLRLEYATPGAPLGVMLSIMSAFALFVLCARAVDGARP